MAKKRKIAKKTAKTKRAKKKSVKKTRARTAKAKRAAGKRTASKRAKAGARRKATKRKVPPRRREDPCQAERTARDRVSEEIGEIREQLSAFDIPDHVRKDLEELLQQKQGRLRFLQQQLDECEARHRPER
jgi:hypothetical protein